MGERRAMTEPKKPSAPPATDERAGRDGRPAYERPRVTRKRAVTRATLFSGGGGPSSTPLVPTG